MQEPVTSNGVTPAAAATVNVQSDQAGNDAAAQTAAAATPATVAPRKSAGPRDPKVVAEMRNMLAGAKLPVLKNHYVVMSYFLAMWFLCVYSLACNVLTNPVNTVNLDDETRVLTSESVSMTHSLYLRNLKNCDITVDTTVTKVLVEDCVGTTLRLKKRIITQILEVWRSTDFKVEIDQPIQTIQVDMCKNLEIFYTTKDHFGSLVWAKSEEVNLHFGDYTDQEELDASGCFSTGLARFTAANPQMDIWPDIDQFIVRFLKSKLQAEVVIRVGGGYATTDREDGEANKRKEAILEKVGEIFFKKVDFKSLESYVKTKAKEQDDEKKRRINDAEEERKRRKLDSASQDKPAPESNPSLN